jgi:hypothetical protein
VDSRAREAQDRVARAGLVVLVAALLLLSAADLLVQALALLPLPRGSRASLKTSRSGSPSKGFSRRPT